MLNAILLFMVLFYVYPLKFLFSYLVNVWTGVSTLVHLPGGAVERMIEPEQLPALMAIFSGGYLAVACVFMLLFRRALSKRKELELDALEVFETRVSIGASMINGAAAAISLVIALVGGARYGGAAGVIYPIVLGPAFTVYYSVMGRRKRKLGLTAARGV